MHELNALAARIEAATGPDRELDAEIDWTVQRLSGRHCQTNAYGDGGGFWLDAISLTHKAPAYTASVDAALMLVPAGTRRISFGSHSGGTGWADIYLPDDSVGECEKAATEMLALAAACLRALAGGGDT